MADIHAWRSGSGTIAAVSSRYYAAGVLTGLDDASVVVTSHTLYAVPYISARAGLIDRIAIEVTAISSRAGDTSSNGACHLGIYAISEAGVPFPTDVKVRDTSGNLHVSVRTTGVRFLSIQASLLANTLYWFTLLCNGGPTLRAVAHPWPIFGFDPVSFAVPQAFLTSSLTFGVLPATFPATFLVGSGGTPPIIAVRHVR